MGRFPADGSGVSILHPVGSGRTSPGAGVGRRRGRRGVPRRYTAVVPGDACAHTAAVPDGVRVHFGGIFARHHAHTDHLLEGARAAAARRVAGAADGRGLPVARPRARLRCGSIRKERTRSDVRLDGRAHFRGVDSAARGVRPAEAPARAGERRAAAAAGARPVAQRQAARGTGCRATTPRRRHVTRVGSGVHPLLQFSSVWEFMGGVAEYIGRLVMETIVVDIVVVNVCLYRVSTMLSPTTPELPVSLVIRYHILIGICTKW